MKNRFSSPLAPGILALVCLLTTSVVVSSARSPQARRRRPDPRVAQLLNELNLKYKVNDDGDYMVVIGLDNNRSQLVTVESQTLRAAKDSSPFRTVSSMAMFTKGALPPAVQNRVKKANEESEGMEPWTILKYRDGTSIEYITTVEADCSAEELRDTINTVATDTDQMEQDLTGQDEF